MSHFTKNVNGSANAVLQKKILAEVERLKKRSCRDNRLKKIDAHKFL
jgi:hypothetical protein